MISKDFFKQLEMFAEARNLDIDKILDAFAKGLVNAYKRENGNTCVRVEFKQEKNEINMYSRKKVVSEDFPMEDVLDALPVSLLEAKQIKTYAKIGDIIETPIVIKDFRRHAVSQAKQVLTQNIKNFEKETTLEKFKQFDQELLTLQVLDVNEKFVKLRIDDTTYASIRAEELIPGENFWPGDKMSVYVSKIDQTKKGVFLNCTRTHPKLVVRLLEKYIPEVAEGIVEIKGISREAGRLTKVCVLSNNEKVDAVGAIIGERGSRINEIIAQLNGERLEVFKFSTEPEILIRNALKPVDVISVASIDVERKQCVVVVPDDQVSLAIGRKGNNIRLFLEASGWSHIDIKSETQANEEGLAW
ncbi:MAG: transcription termination factor NusA [bacterium]